MGTKAPSALEYSCEHACASLVLSPWTTSRCALISTAPSPRLSTFLYSRWTAVRASLYAYGTAENMEHRGEVGRRGSYVGRRSLLWCRLCRRAVGETTVSHCNRNCSKGHDEASAFPRCRRVIERDQDVVVSLGDSVDVVLTTLRGSFWRPVESTESQWKICFLAGTPTYTFLSEKFTFARLYGMGRTRFLKDDYLHSTQRVAPTCSEDISARKDCGHTKRVSREKTCRRFRFAPTTIGGLMQGGCCRWQLLLLCAQGSSICHR
jgi:hypothetical protein